MSSPRQSSVLNALSVDVEDYFHVEAFASRIAYDDWHTYESRVEKNVDTALEIFARHQFSATFYVLGWVAEHFPQMVKKIAGAGHEIGCHGYAHQHIHRQTPEKFRQDVRLARQRIMDQTQKPVSCYRAPSFSIVETTLWALDILAEEGFTIDSSIFPVRHDLYGIPGSPRFPHWRSGIFEFPPTKIGVSNLNIGIGGGGYLRLFPYSFTRWAVRKINEAEKQPVMVYFHPWELDHEQPRLSAPFRSRLRHYTNLKKCEERLRRLLADFKFGTARDCLEKYRLLSDAVAGAG